MQCRCLLLLMLAFIVGCGPASATITGEVTVNGQPMKKGLISIAPADGVGDPRTSPIEDGKYHIQTVVGKKFVQISEPIVVAKTPESNAPDAKILEFTEERLPERYNVKSELTLDVRPGANSKDWPLESKK